MSSSPNGQWLQVRLDVIVGVYCSRKSGSGCDYLASSEQLQWLLILALQKQHLANVFVWY